MGNGELDRYGIVVGPHAPVMKDMARRMRRNPTPAEALLWEHLRNGKLDGMHFRRQQVIDGFIVDFYCHAKGLVIEIDGGIHDLQIEHDTDRSRLLAARGLRIIRFCNESVTTDVGHVLAQNAAAAMSASR